MVLSFCDGPEDSNWLNGRLYPKVLVEDVVQSRGKSKESIIEAKVQSKINLVAKTQRKALSSYSESIVSYIRHSSPEDTSLAS